MDSAVAKLKARGVTVSINTHDGQEPTGVSAVMKQAAQEAGIYEGQEGN